MDRCATVLVSIAFLGCGKTAPKPQPSSGAALTLNGTLRNMLAPLATASPTPYAPVDTENFSTLCSGPPQAQIQICDLYTLLSGQFTALATCTTDPTSGQFSCHGDQLGTIAKVAVAYITNAPGAPDCIAPTVVVPFSCADNCAATSIASAGVLKEGDPGTEPLLVFSSVAVSQWEAQVATQPTFSEFGALLTTGVVATILVPPAGGSVAEVIPWQPLICNTPGTGGTNSCVDWVIAADGTIDTTATSTTPSPIGMFLSQGQFEPTGGGAPSFIPLDVSGNADQGFGGIDCSPTPQCYTPAPDDCTRAGEIPGTSTGFISMNYVAASAPAAGVCPLQTALTSDGKTSRYNVCPGN